MINFLKNLFKSKPEPKRINEKGLDLIKSFESCRLSAYRDIVGVWTIGYGSTGPDVHQGLTLSLNQAHDRLMLDLDRFELGVSDLVKTPLNSNQFSALVSFAFNVGLGALKSSHLLTEINLGYSDKAADQFLLWDHALGKQVAGLTRRRIAERALFLEGEIV